MRLATYRSSVDAAEHVAVVGDGELRLLRDPVSLVELLAAGPDAIASAAASAQADPLEVVDEHVAAVSPRLRAPIPVPPSVRDFMAFEEHVVTSTRAFGRTVDPFWYEAPAFYFTNPAAIAGPNDTIAVPPGCTRFDYELEVAVVIGRGGSDIPVGEAAHHIAGYTLLADWSARDLQFKEIPIGLGPVKAKDSATSLGPWLVTPDELDPALGLDMTASVNGREYSRGRLSDLYWSFPQMISYASRGTRLVPGDILGSGTVGTGCILELAGVHGEEKYPWLVPGDTVRLAVDGLGAVETTVHAGLATPHPLS